MVINPNISFYVSALNDFMNTETVKNTVAAIKASDTKNYCEANGVKVLHLFNKEHSFGGVTIVYEPVCKTKKTKSSGDFAKVSVAYCNKTDQYDRKLGVQLAVDNLRGGNYILMPIYRAAYPTQLLLNFFSEME